MKTPKIGPIVAAEIAMQILGGCTINIGRMPNNEFLSQKPQTEAISSEQDKTKAAVETVQEKSNPANHKFLTTICKTGPNAEIAIHEATMEEIMKNGLFPACEETDPVKIVFDYYNTFKKRIDDNGTETTMQCATFIINDPETSISCSSVPLPEENNKESEEETNQIYFDPSANNPIEI